MLRLNRHAMHSVTSVRAPWAQRQWPTSTMPSAFCALQSSALQAGMPAMLEEGKLVQPSINFASVQQSLLR